MTKEEPRTRKALSIWDDNNNKQTQAVHDLTLWIETTPEEYSYMAPAERRRRIRAKWEEENS